MDGGGPSFRPGTAGGSVGAVLPPELPPARSEGDAGLIEIPGCRLPTGVRRKPTSGFEPLTPSLRVNLIGDAKPCKGGTWRNCHGVSGAPSGALLSRGRRGGPRLRSHGGVRARSPRRASATPSRCRADLSGPRGPELPHYDETKPAAPRTTSTTPSARTRAAIPASALRRRNARVLASAWTARGPAICARDRDRHHRSEEDDLECDEKRHLDGQPFPRGRQRRKRCAPMWMWFQ